MGGGQFNPDEMQERLESTQQVIEEVDKQFKNPVRNFLAPRSHLYADGLFDRI